MTIRQTVRVLARKIKAAKAENPGVPVGDLVMLNAGAVGKASNPRFVLQASFMLGGVKTDVIVSDDSGKVRYFQSVESAIRAFAGAGEDSNGIYQVKVYTDSLYASSVPADVYTAAESKVVKLNKVKIAQQVKYGALDVLLNGAMLGWENGNAAQQAKRVEANTQQSTIMDDITAINEEVAELQALIGSKP